jgi:hypothetical protein
VACLVESKDLMSRGFMTMKEVMATIPTAHCRLICAGVQHRSIRFLYIIPSQHQHLLFTCFALLHVLSRLLLTCMRSKLDLALHQSVKQWCNAQLQQGRLYG